MRSSYWIIIGALLIAEIAAVFETTMIYVALPTLIREFGDPVLGDVTDLGTDFFLTDRDGIQKPSGLGFMLIPGAGVFPVI